MVAAEAPADYAKLLFRTEPFSKMASARRFQLLSQARSVRFFNGHHVIPKGQPPGEVLLVLGGKVRMEADVPGSDEMVLLGEYGPGACVGWDIALADVCGVQAVAIGEVVGLLVAAPSFIEIARFDEALQQSFLLRPSVGEVWWAVLSELQRRDEPVEKAPQIVDRLLPVCTTRDWPDQESAIVSKSNYIWIVSGGEGIFPGTLWGDSTGVLWARLTGIPEEQFERALSGREVEVKAPVAKLQSAIRAVPESSVVTAAKAEVPTPTDEAGGGIIKRIAKAALVAVVAIAAVSAGVCGWASRQPTFETVSAEGSLHFVGDSHELSAALTGKLAELRIQVGQNVAKGEVLAVVQPPKDEAKAKMLAETLLRAKQHIEFCERVLRGIPVRPTDAPQALVNVVRDLGALKSEHRIKTGINLGRTDDPALTPDERARIVEYFDTLKADRAARVDAAQSDSSIRREDLADAEEALRGAKEELALQIQAAASLGAERGDEAKAEAASAQRAIAVYRRVVSQKQETVNRLKKSIASIRVAPAAVAPAAPVSLEKTELAIVEAEKAIRRFSASNRILAVETEIAIEQLTADAAPRHVTALYPGLITHVETVLPESPVAPETRIGKIVTRQAWEIECPEESVRFLKNGQEFKISTPGGEGIPVRTARFTGVLPGPKKNRARISHAASDDRWRDGRLVKIEARVVTGNLLDRWLMQIGVVRP